MHAISRNFHADSPIKSTFQLSPWPHKWATKRQVGPTRQGDQTLPRARYSGRTFLQGEWDIGFLPYHSFIFKETFFCFPNSNNSIFRFSPHSSFMQWFLFLFVFFLSPSSSLLPHVGEKLQVGDGEMDGIRLWVSFSESEQFSCSSFSVTSFDRKKSPVKTGLLQEGVIWGIPIFSKLRRSLIPSSNHKTHKLFLGFLWLYTSLSSLVLVSFWDVACQTSKVSGLYCRRLFCALTVLSCFQLLFGFSYNQS